MSEGAGSAWQVMHQAEIFDAIKLLLAAHS
jgi:hypothetical protein